MTKPQGSHACPCIKWRALEFDGLRYLAWHSKSEEWRAMGRKQRKCGMCLAYQWIDPEAKKRRS